MNFTIVPRKSRPAAASHPEAFLEIDSWNDYNYGTLFHLIIVDSRGKTHDIGSVKIARFNMPEGDIRSELPNRFERLDDKYFSLGQDPSYYENLTSAGNDIRSDVLNRLRDVAYDLGLFTRARDEDVMQKSLLRFVTESTVRGQFWRLARGGAKLSEYNFSYVFSNPSHTKELTLDFNVEPESHPPTNMHVLIGRNGVGKTYLLNNMTLSAIAAKRRTTTVGAFHSGTGYATAPLFANLVSVTFSAFDPFDPPPHIGNTSTSRIRYAYIGLKTHGDDSSGVEPRPKTHDELSAEFSASVRRCRNSARLDRWKAALCILESDPLFEDQRVADLADYEKEDDDQKSAAANLFRRLSSGHKIVLLTITRLIETVEERTLVLLDEPEAHLHPPLLSAFLRALSELLIDRNGVAIIATHSPVVLQEVPRRCVWKIRRSGDQVVAERPEIETFGENVGTLTHEAFGLEVTNSGFHKLLRERVYRNESYDAILGDFDGALGGEAKAIVRGLIATRDAGHD